MVVERNKEKHTRQGNRNNSSARKPTSLHTGDNLILRQDCYIEKVPILRLIWHLHMWLLDMWLLDICAIRVLFFFFFFCVPQLDLWGSPFFFFFFCVPQLDLWCFFFCVPQLDLWGSPLFFFFFFFFCVPQLDLWGSPFFFFF